MAAKRALVVDDSRSARAFLSRLLDKHGLEVDTADSAEAAIAQLERQRPDVIFMDHLMPGMDGFQAVQTIKSNPLTAGIPILMYTSQEGELYLGQARALGATGVLPKQIKPGDVALILQQLDLIDEQHSELEPAADGFPQPLLRPAGDEVMARIEVLTAATLAAAHATATAPAAAPAATNAAGTQAPMTPQALPALGTVPPTDIRAILNEALEQHSERLRSEFRQIVSDLPPPVIEQGSGWRGTFYAVVMTVVALVLAALWLQGEVERRTLRVQVAQLATDKLLAGSDASPSAPDEQQAPGVPRGPLMLPVPYGEVLLSGARVARVQAVLAQLAAAGFQGAVDLQAFPGSFCLSGDASQGFVPAVATAAAGSCNLMGNPVLDAAGGPQAESAAFTTALEEFRRAHGDNIEVRVVGGTIEQALRPYPEGDPSMVTAGDWNAAAAVNNRLEVRWRARP